jgi:hypothetical protein
MMTDNEVAARYAKLTLRVPAKDSHESVWRRYEMHCGHISSIIAATMASDVSDPDPVNIAAKVVALYLETIGFAWTKEDIKRLGLDV